MWRAMGDEMRRALAMSRDGFEEIRSGRARNHPAWLADPHLRRGFLLTVPFLLIGVLILALVAAPAWLSRHDLRPALLFGVPFSLAVNGLWFFLAARSRTRESGR